MNIYSDVNLTSALFFFLLFFFFLRQLKYFILLIHIPIMWIITPGSFLRKKEKDIIEQLPKM